VISNFGSSINEGFCIIFFIGFFFCGAKIYLAKYYSEESFLTHDYNHAYLAL
jgi:hypothetical protein